MLIGFKKTSCRTRSDKLASYGQQSFRSYAALVSILPSRETMGSTLVLLAFSGVALQANSGVAVSPATAATTVSWQQGRCSPLFLFLLLTALFPPFGAITCMLAFSHVTLTDVFVAKARASYWTGAFC